ncbi:MAG TPA: L-threonylcarbamoyladenylate synthase [Granulicella sp.]|jgi:L-threonylcarbamoyladenylate synthase|nr:L-threonylcarbamoyladenylate synthase [Granulicella sp.]
MFPPNRREASTTLRLSAGSEADLSRAAEILQAGGTVALPTETVYGLGAKALDPAAVAKIFAAKARPNWDPLIVHIADRAMLDRIAAIPPDLQSRIDALIAAFWPGPLTLLLPRTAAVPDAVTAGRALVGVRMPAHPVALALLRRAGVPVAAPSANRFGRTSPTTAAHVLDDLDGRIDAVLDGGPTHVGVESTVLDPTQSPLVIYRPGAVTAAMIAEATGCDVTLFRPRAANVEAAPESLPSPGVGLRHYAPRARLVLVEGPGGLAAALGGLKNGRVGIMLPDGWAVPDGAEVFAWGPWDEQDRLAQRLFAGLRTLDAAGVDVILCPVPAGEGVAAALRDRLEKAARPV